MKPSQLIPREEIAEAYDRIHAKKKKLREVLKEVSGCHTEHATPRLCTGCLTSIRRALEDSD